MTIPAWPCRDTNSTAPHGGGGTDDGSMMSVQERRRWWPLCPSSLFLWLENLFFFFQLNHLAVPLKHSKSTMLCWVAQSRPTLYQPMDCSSPGSSVHEDSPGKNPRVGCLFLCQGNFPTPGIEPGSPDLQVDSIPVELLGKPISQLYVNKLYILRKN